MKLDEFNSLENDERLSCLLGCCNCRAWAGRLAQCAPFSDLESLLREAALIWEAAGEEEILEAFSGHPQIGDLEALRNRYAERAHAEQGQVLSAPDETLAELKDMNEAYLERHGFIFIVCASGKSAGEMLEMVKARLPNSRAAELANGSREQGAIMALRIKQLIEE